MGRYAFSCCMKLISAWLLIPLLSLAQEGDFKEVKDPEVKREDAIERKEKSGLPQTEYKVRNIGKTDPRFTAIYKEVAASNPQLTLDSLYSRILAGGTFKVERVKAMTCRGCNGFGRIPDKGSGSRSGDGKLACPDCKGAGKVDATQVIVIKW